MKYIYVLSIFILVLGSCTKDKSAAPLIENIKKEPCSDTLSFSGKILPAILTPSCNTSGCHNSTTAAAGLDLTTYAGVAPISEILLKSMNHESGISPMPKNAPKMNDSLIAIFECWINQGKLNN